MVWTESDKNLTNTTTLINQLYKLRTVQFLWLFARDLGLKWQWILCKAMVNDSCQKGCVDTAVINIIQFLSSFWASI